MTTNATWTVEDLENEVRRLTTLGLQLRLALANYDQVNARTTLSTVTLTPPNSIARVLLEGSHP